MTGPVALSLENLQIRYGPMTAVERLSLHVHRGEVVGLLGPNGSGKSSTLAAAAGVLTPVAGTVTIDGIQATRDPVRYARNVGLVPQVPALYDELTVEANLVFFGRLYQIPRVILTRRVEELLEFARLVDRRHVRVGTLSGGLKQRLNLACALIHEPAVLLLDEPTAALDPASRDALYIELHTLRDAGHAILLTTHHLDEVEHGCDRIAVLDRGRVVAYGRPAELARSMPGGRAILYAHLRERLPLFFERSLKRRLGNDVEVELTGRRLRLSAPTQEELGRALAIVLSDGVVLETFRTPPGRLESLLRGTSTPAPVEASCDAA